jgi:acyl-CoA synthetase (AMP-forming)/AMP-acid ligase II
MTGWNIADVLDVVADEVPGSLALVQGDRRLTWGEVDARAARVAAFLLDHGLEHGDTVAQYLRNCPEYIESMYAAIKASLVPVNTNYRYLPSELEYLWTDADARAVVFGSSFTANVDQVRHTLPRVRAWLWVDEGGSACPSWATPYQTVATTPCDPPTWNRDGDDLVILYTGGTTGMPKGVLWRQDDLFVVLGNAANGKYPDEPSLDYARSRVSPHGRMHLTAAPLMHGAGCFTCIPIMARGGGIVLLEKPSFDPAELLDAIERERVHSVSWVGDAFAKPVVAALHAEPDRWDLGSWRVVTSGGVLFSEEVKRELLDLVPDLLIADVYGSSEAVAAARSVSTRSSGTGSPRTFARTSTIRVLDDDGHDTAPGVIGMLAYGGRQPLGYRGDEEKTASTFRVVDGERMLMTGDFATLDEEGLITVLGRGSSCVNTGGEKVYPEEVEEVLKRHALVHDAVVVGIADDRLGERVVAAVALESGQALDADAIVGFAREHLASFKVPRGIIAVDLIERGPNGKVDHERMRTLIMTRLVDLDDAVVVPGATVRS